MSGQQRDVWEELRDAAICALPPEGLHHARYQQRLREAINAVLASSEGAGHEGDDKTAGSNTVADIPDDQLLERAMRNVKGTRGLPRWSAVGKAFGLGSTYSAQLCMRFGLDPHELLGGREP